MRARLVIIMIGLLSTNAYAQLLQQDPVEAIMTPGNGAQAMPVVEERLHVTIDGQHATSTLLQVFENNTGARTEGRYRLRAGSNSHVEGFAYWNGEQKIVGEVFEKQMARQVYESTVARKRDPALLEQDGEGAFAFRVFPIEAREKKRVELHWSKWLDRRTKTVRYHAPITRADAEIVISLTGPVKNIRSSTHRFHVENTGDGVRLRSEGGRTTGELILEWQVDDADWRPTVSVQPSAKGDGWFVLALAAPDVGDKAVAAKDVTIVIDDSGSMTGEKMEHAQAAAKDMVRLLNPGDRLNVISFSDDVDRLFQKPHAADPDTRDHALKYIARLHAGGGTDIALALRTAIKAQERDAGRPRVVVFLTDGQSDAKLAMDAANEDAGDIRLFTVGLGEDVNKPLLEKLAGVKRGRFLFINSATAIERDVSRLAASIAKPLLVGISVDVEGAQAERLYPRTLPDLFAQDELVVTGRIRGKGTAKFVVHGRLGGKEVAFTRSVDLPKAAAKPWVGRLWAQARVDHLLEEISLGTKDNEMQNEVIELALAYNFVTPYTSFLAIPESELGAMKGTVEAAREQKRKILANNQDAAALSGRRDARDDDAKDSRRSGRQGLGTAAGDSLDDASDDNEMLHLYGADSDETATAPRHEAENISPTGVAAHRHGCAGCATSGPDAGGALLLVAVVIIVGRRRRTR